MGAGEGTGKLRLIKLVLAILAIMIMMVVVVVMMRTMMVIDDGDPQLNHADTRVGGGKGGLRT